MKILLIEDDRELADSMRFQLEKEGYESYPTTSDYQ